MSRHPDPQSLAPGVDPQQATLPGDRLRKLLELLRALSGLFGGTPAAAHLEEATQKVQAECDQNP
jgi:hypothetical protein